MTAQRGSRPRPDDSRQRGRRTQSVRRRGFAAALLFLLALLSFPFLAAAQDAPETLTLAQARALSPEVLARRLLGASAVLVREAAVQGGVGMWWGPDHLLKVVFAGAPRSAGRPDLCEADRITVAFTSSGSAPERGGPATIRDLARDTVYRSVDVGPVPEQPSDTYEKALGAACARIGPVLTQDAEVRSRFFTSSFLEPERWAPSVVARFHTRIFADLGRSLRSGAGPAIDCGTAMYFWSPDTDQPCAERVLSTAARPPNAIRTQPCEKAPAHWCVEARYDEGWLKWTTLTVETDQTNDPFDSVASYRALLIRHEAVE